MEGIDVCTERRKTMNSRRIWSNRDHYEHARKRNNINVLPPHGVREQHRHPIIMMSILKFPEFGEPRYSNRRLSNHHQPTRVAKKHGIGNLILS